jgi:hypothetical protein
MSESRRLACDDHTPDPILEAFEADFAEARASARSAFAERFPHSFVGVEVAALEAAAASARRDGYVKAAEEWIRLHPTCPRGRALLQMATSNVSFEIIDLVMQIVPLPAAVSPASSEGSREQA